MSEMVERVAREIYDALGISDPEAYSDALDDPARVAIDGEFNLFDVAKAAIAAIREPTETMIFAGANVPRLLKLMNYNAAANEVWHAMIEEALREEMR